MLDPQVIADWQNGDNVKVASVTGTGGKGVLESVGYKPSKTSDGGNLSDDNSVERESYDRFISYDLTEKGRSGYNIYHTATNIYDDPNYYSLVFRHCDDIACEILKQGGINPLQLILPNWTYDVSNLINEITN